MWNPLCESIFISWGQRFRWAEREQLLAGKGVRNITEPSSTQSQLLENPLVWENLCTHVLPIGSLPKLLSQCLAHVLDSRDCVVSNGWLVNSFKVVLSSILISISIVRSLKKKKNAWWRQLPLDGRMSLKTQLSTCFCDLQLTMIWA